MSLLLFNYLIKSGGVDIFLSLLWNTSLFLAQLCLVYQHESAQSDIRTDGDGLYAAVYEERSELGIIARCLCVFIRVDKYM